MLTTIFFNKSSEIGFYNNKPYYESSFICLPQEFKDINDFYEMNPYVQDNKNYEIVELQDSEVENLLKDAQYDITRVVLYDGKPKMFKDYEVISLEDYRQYTMSKFLSKKITLKYKEMTINYQHEALVNETQKYVNRALARDITTFLLKVDNDIFLIEQVPYLILNEILIKLDVISEQIAIKTKEVESLTNNEEIYNVYQSCTVNTIVSIDDILVFLENDIETKDYKTLDYSEYQINKAKEFLNS